MMTLSEYLGKVLLCEIGAIKSRLWEFINYHPQICDRLDERVRLMQDYLDCKPDDFAGIDVKRSLLDQAREQVTWYRQSIDALDYVGAVACRRALKTGQHFLSTICPLQLPRNRTRHRIQTRSRFSDLTPMW